MSNAPFASLVNSRRRREIRLNALIGSVRAFNSAMLSSTTPVCVALTLSSLSSRGFPILPSQVFTAVSLFGQLRFPVLFYPMVVQAFFDGGVSFGRIHKYLNTPGSRPPNALALPITLRPGVTAIVGPVGSGKTTLLKSLPGALYEQEPWLSTGSLEESIVFRRPLERANLDRVLEVSQLKDDIRSGVLDLGGSVGPGGSSLSGGQRARAALARTLYSAGEEVLIDDCFASLDARVGKAVFDGLMSWSAGRRVALVTNDMEMAKRCDRVVVLENGRVKDEGTWEEVRRDESRSGNIRSRKNVSNSSLRSSCSL